MRLSDLDFSYPEDLIALEPSRPTRVAFKAPQQAPIELDMVGLIEKFGEDDILVINDTRVIPARVFTDDGLEILFLSSADAQTWEVLFPARGLKAGESLTLPGGVQATLQSKGLPQVLKTSAPLTSDYFQKHGELALPPYIQEQRKERHNRAQDRDWYQTAWAERPGSVAAPTASLHFQTEHLNALRERGVSLEKVTLHVGAGTFLPIRTDDLAAHVMHPERVEISGVTAEKILRRQNRVWALGTTVTRSLESLASGLLTETDFGYAGDTRLFIRPPYEYRAVDALLTNFHQPRTTLMALVAAIAGLENVHSTYQWAIERRFKLFSYGDLSAWIK